MIQDRSKWIPNRWLAAALLLSLAHFAWLATNVVSGYSHPDSDGYVGQAGLLVAHGSTTFEVESPAQYVGMHWLEKPDGGYVSRYPPGVSLLLASTWLALGRDAAFYVNPALASLTVFVLFWFTRRWAGPLPAFGAALLQAFHAEANSHALGSTSHTATTFFLIAGLALLDRWSTNGSRASALAAGLFLGFIPSLRYAEAAAALGIAAFLVYQCRRPERRAGIALVCAGAIIPVTWMLIRNHAEFGAFWRTAYYLTGESNLSWQYFLENWSMYLLAPLDSGAGLFYGLALSGFVLMIRDQAARPIGTALAVTAGAITFVYMCYYFTSGSAARFLLPVIPIYLLAGAYGLSKTLRGRTLTATFAVLIAIQALPGLANSRQEIARQFASSERGAILVDTMTEEIPAGSVVLISERYANEQVHHVQRWKLADSTLLGDQPRRMGMPPGGMRGESDRPSPRQPGKAEALRSGYEGLSGRQRTRAVFDDLQRWAGGASIYWILPQGQADSHLRLLRGLADAKEVANIEFPDSGITPRFGGGRRGGRGRRGAAGPPPDVFPMGGAGGLGPPGGIGGPGAFGGRRGGPGGLAGGPFGGGSGPLTIYRLHPLRPADTQPPV